MGGRIGVTFPRVVPVSLTASLLPTPSSYLQNPEKTSQCLCFFAGDHPLLLE